jgi:hypothetical protein
MTNPNQIEIFSTSADFKGFKNLGEIGTYLWDEIISGGAGFFMDLDKIFLKIVAKFWYEWFLNINKT